MISGVPLPLEIVAGLFSGFFVAPFNTIVDRSIIENANGKTPLWEGVANGLKSFAFTPATFLKSYAFKWIFFVYSTTYATSNLCDHIRMGSIDPALIKLTLTFLVNTTASLVKDKALAQVFGATEVRPFPNSSFVLFLLRDIVAVASAFTIPPILGKAISDRTGASEQRGLKIAQIISPLLIQFIGTPLHLLGLDIYNHPNATTMERMQHMKAIYWNSLLLRMLRFLPAYGIGGIVNIELRNYFRQFGSSSSY